MIRSIKSIFVATGLFVLFAGFRGHVEDFPKDAFRSPLSIPLVMAGNFAEMRSDHFHSGLDLKTENREGLPVYAAADGWVSRVKVSPYGYGYALYVSHPNGYTTVYAHLQTFSDVVAGYVKERQYATSRFEVDKYLPENRFPVRKGDVIGRSGNSGSSFGPHLHFEIRASSSQTPINPLLFGLDVRDTLPPKIFRVKLYPNTDGSAVRVHMRGVDKPILATKKTPLILDAVATGDSGNSYRLADVEKMTAVGSLGFGVQVHDYHDGSRNRLGAYSIRLLSNSDLLFESELTKFPFGQTRYINAHVDYAEHIENHRWIQRSHKLPGNALKIYNGINDGFLGVQAGSTYLMEYQIADAAGNSSMLRFEILGMDAAPVNSVVQSDGSYRVQRSEAKTIAGDRMRLHFRSDTFYEDFDFSYAVEGRLSHSYSSVYALHNSSVPLHRSMTLSIQGDDVPAELRKKALVARVDEKNELASAGGAYRDGFVIAKPRSFGRYTVAVDTTAPRLEPYRFPNDGRFSDGESIRFLISDNLSGIESYTGFLDSKWVLFEFDAKKKIISHRVDADTERGLRKLVVRAEDGKGNVTTVARSVNITD